MTLTSYKSEIWRKRKSQRVGKHQRAWWYQKRYSSKTITKQLCRTIAKQVCGTISLPIVEGTIFFSQFWQECYFQHTSMSGNNFIHHPHNVLAESTTFDKWSTVDRDECVKPHQCLVGPGQMHTASDHAQISWKHARTRRESGYLRGYLDSIHLKFALVY